MKAAVLFLVLIGLQCWVACANVVAPPGVNPAITTTTPKSWGQKVKSGLSKFFKGAAVVGAVQGIYANHKAIKHANKPH